MTENLDQTYLRLLDVSGSLALLVVLAMLLERALALIFDYHWFQEYSKKREGLKTPIAFLASWFTCNHVNFDVLCQLFKNSGGLETPSHIGILITSAVVAGGSAGAITLFQGVLNFSRDARNSLLEANKANAEAQLQEALARKSKAEAEIATHITQQRSAELERTEIEAKTLSGKYLQTSDFDNHIDGCCIENTVHVTEDHDLPAAEGGVSPL